MWTKINQHKFLSDGISFEHATSERMNITGMHVAVVKRHLSMSMLLPFYFYLHSLISFRFMRIHCWNSRKSTNKKLARHLLLSYLLHANVLRTYVSTDHLLLPLIDTQEVHLSLLNVLKRDFEIFLGELLTFLVGFCWPNRPISRKTNIPTWQSNTLNRKGIENSLRIYFIIYWSRKDSSAHIKDLGQIVYFIGIKYLLNAFC